MSDELLLSRLRSAAAPTPPGTERHPLQDLCEEALYELEVAQRDAARYREIRRSAGRYDTAYGAVDLFGELGEGEIDADALDVAIDRAIAEQGEAK